MNVFKFWYYASYDVDPLSLNINLVEIFSKETIALESQKSSPEFNDMPWIERSCGFEK